MMRKQPPWYMSNETRNTITTSGPRSQNAILNLCNRATSKECHYSQARNDSQAYAPCLQDNTAMSGSKTAHKGKHGTGNIHKMAHPWESDQTRCDATHEETAKMQM